MFDFNLEMGDVNIEPAENVEGLYDLQEFNDNLFNDYNMLGASTTFDELQNFEIIESNNDVFNASDAMEYYEYQGETNRCGQYSQLFVIEEFLGVDIDIETFCDFSEANGWFSEDIGTTFDNLNKMLDQFGIANELSDNNSFDDLMECLENDGRAIVAVDSGEYWEGEGFWDDIIEPMGADHAIEVIGYDEATDCVIVNDSGSPKGCGEMIPRDVFIDAWEDSNCTMVECYK